MSLRRSPMYHHNVAGMFHAASARSFVGRPLSASFVVRPTTACRSALTPRRDTFVTSTMPIPVATRRFVGTELLSSTGPISSSRDLAVDLKESRLKQNKDIIASIGQQQGEELVWFRKQDRPWEIVPQYVRRRVVDMSGVLKSTDRMEMEQTINKILPICDLDLYVVIVPTVGYVPPRIFAQSLFFDWQIGEPRGNGLLLVVCRQEATVQMISSPAIAEYFGQDFCDLLIKEVLSPLVQEGQPSYAMVQTVYAIARHAQEFRHDWQRGILTLPQRNKVRFFQQTVHYGIKTWNVYAVVIITAMTVMLWQYILDMNCPECGTQLSRIVDEAAMIRELDAGQRIEREQGCTQFKVMKCQKCHRPHITVIVRDVYHNSKCLPCESCHYHTVNLTTSIDKLPTKAEDGIKRHVYACQHCRLAREITLPLYRPLEKEEDKDKEWYDFLLKGATSPKLPESTVVNKK